MNTEEIIQTYILQLLELQETKLNCINLGFDNSRDTRIEKEIIKDSKEYLKKKGFKKYV